MSYRVRLIREEAGLRQLEEAWTGLLLHSPRATVFASFQWNFAWWRHFRAHSSLHVLTVWKDARQLAAVAPFMVRRAGPVRKLEFLGTGLSDYGDVLLHPDYAAEAAAALFAYLRANHKGWDLGDWREVPAGSLLLGALSARKPRGLRVASVPQTSCAAISLPASWEEYVGGLARKRRYYVSSFPRKFMRERAGSLETVERGPALGAAVERFRRLHLTRWASREGTLSAEHLDVGFAPFLQEVCARCAERGWLRIVSLKTGDEVVASSLNFVIHGRWSGYMKGFDPRWSEARPGTVLDALRIKQAIIEGTRQFDFGRGDEEYKSGYGAVVARNTRLLVATRAPRSLAAYALLAWHTRRRPGVQPVISRALPPDL